MFLNIFAIDFFSLPPYLNFDKKALYSSFLGVFSTYIYLGVTILAFLNFGSELYLKESPIVTVRETIHSLTSPPIIETDPHEFPLALGIYENGSLIPYDKTYFNFVGRKLIIKPLQEKGRFQFIEQEFELDNCSKNYIPDFQSEKERLCIGNKFLKSFSNHAFNETEEKNRGFYIKGFFGAEEYTQIIISISKCKNSTENNQIGRDKFDFFLQFVNIYFKSI